MSEINISVASKSKVEGQVATKQKINAEIYPRGPKGDTGLQGPKGEPGNSIVNIEKTKTEGLVDTYTITLSDGSTFDFNVTNANAGSTYTKTEIEQFLLKKLNVTDIVNSLDSEETDKALSAKQGKILKGLIDANYTSAEIDELLLNNKKELQDNIETAIEESVTTAKATGYLNGSTTSINTLNTSGKWRVHIPAGSEDATYLGFYGGVIVETFVQIAGMPSIQRITQMGTGTTVIRYCTTNAFSYSNALHCVAVPINKSYTITSDFFKFKKTSKRSSYIVEGSKVTLFMCLNTKQALTAKTQYSITGTHPTPVDYMATTGIFHTPTCVAEVFVFPDGTIAITPSEDIASGKEFNAQITYFIY